MRAMKKENTANISNISQRIAIAGDGKFGVKEYEEVWNYIQNVVIIQIGGCFMDN